MTTINYNISMPCVEYNNEFEYRKVLRKIFNMKEIIVDDPDLDEITRDEMNFDTDALSVGHAQLYDLVKDNLLFYDLFIKAASFMISENPETGFCIMFSYDYLKMFYKLLIKHDTITVQDADYNAFYNTLYN